MITLPNGKKLEILSSWDDGGELDMALADILIKYKIPAVFYIPIKTRDLSDHQVRQLAGTLPNCPICKITSKLFEIGAHTMTHPKEIQLLSDKDILREVVDSKTSPDGKFPSAPPDNNPQSVDSSQIVPSQKHAVKSSSSSEPVRYAPTNPPLRSGVPAGFTSIVTAA